MLVIDATEAYEMLLLFNQFVLLGSKAGNSILAVSMLFSDFCSLEFDMMQFFGCLAVVMVCETFEEIGVHFVLTF